MTQAIDFDDITNYADRDIPDAMQRLLADNEFVSIVLKLLAPIDKQQLTTLLLSIRTAYEFKFKVIYPVFKRIMDKTSKGFTCTGVAYLDNPGLIISNHRDIVMDPSLVNLALMQQQRDTSAIAIGDNLLTLPWIKELVRVCGAFIVKRQEKTAKAYAQLSAYIYKVINEERRLLWIAQREGRAKDSNDQTQESILKMFTFLGEGTFMERLQRLNVIPTSISYEYDPCDYLKAQELIRRHVNPDYKKAPGEDVFSMRTGIMGQKGRIHITYTGPITDELTQIAVTTPRRVDQVEAVKQLIDKRIFSSYQFFPINYVAYDLRHNTNRFADRYTEEERTEAVDYLKSRVALSELPEANHAELWDTLLAIYSNTLCNHLKTCEEKK
ncbi:MAG: 1-acyl-sn-glycerol-3-phosphate acyltransferase [Bacteroidales bacterium]|nr:1-acyl-sn-glycerol-3-phosphate acyltransferase [Bacteroidales bacterium]